MQGIHRTYPDYHAYTLDLIFTVREQIVHTIDMSIGVFCAA
jgi:hypothetical protein